MEVRAAVFVVEQGVACEIEVDGRDQNCVHFLARDGGGNPVGTARLDREGHVGRVAVLAAWRRKGVGSRLMEAAVGKARKLGMARVELNSQTHATRFYERLGFEVVGEEFAEAGIPHVRMVMES